jgi:flavin reductase (DIM6/NTAB) family NADH-FMN oxidoreductase RutF
LQVVKPPRPADAHAALECREYATMEIGRSRIFLGHVVAIYVEDSFMDPAGPCIKADELHAIGRINGLGNYVRTRDAFMTIPRISYEEWKSGKR